MSLEEVIEEIRQQGRQESEEILESAQQERERMLAEVRSKAEESRAERLRLAEERGAREEVREIARAELEARKALLQAQKEVLDEVREAAASRLRDLEGNDRLLEGLVEHSREDLEGGLVRCNPADEAVLKRLTGRPVRGDLEVLGGFVIETEAGDRRIDLTYDTFLDGLWEQAIRDVADILWRGD